MSATSRHTLRVIIAGGGTGGHVFPALAIGQTLIARTPDARILYVGTRHGAEAQIIPSAGGDLRTLWISGFSRRHLLRNLLLPLKLTVSLLQSAQMLMSFRPHLVVGTGGYVMGPVLWTAQRLGYPTLLQEQNSYPGYTTRRLARRAQAVCVGFEDAARRLDGCRVTFTGNPLRPSFRTLDRETARASWNLDLQRPTLLVFGGSAGARSINSAVGAALPRLLDHWNLIWQTGRLGLSAGVDSALIARAIEKRQLVLREFIHNMPEAYAAADLAICRAGAMTLAELAAAGLPAILIPYPYATDDHQTANAQAVVAAGAAETIKDSQLDAEALFTMTKRLLESEPLRTRMAERMKSLSRLDAAERIVDLILSFARKS
ncbi:MAG: undecaprenyldiphospho-muramoylpentapeptide beta-N-acetylglucosaminyltransferase [bacterium]|nr:undecaprenyldiphospho-muramoylpentapeptide beta-N-acetylglucosaminyltransferase [bacterium]